MTDFDVDDVAWGDRPVFSAYELQMMELRVSQSFLREPERTELRLTITSESLRKRVIDHEMNAEKFDAHTTRVLLKAPRPAHEDLPPTHAASNDSLATRGRQHKVHPCPHVSPGGTICYLDGSVRHSWHHGWNPIDGATSWCSE